MSVEIPWYGILFFAILFLEIAYYINATVFPIGGIVDMPKRRELTSAHGMSLEELSTVVDMLVRDAGLEIVKITEIEHGDDPVVSYELRRPTDFSPEEEDEFAENWQVTIRRGSKS